MHLANRANFPETAPAWPRLVSGAALVLALALVISRATFLETLRDSEMVTPNTQGVPREAGVTTSLIFDLLLCGPALLLLLRRAFDENFRLFTHASHLLFAALAAWAAASTFWAADKFAACVNAAHLVSAAALMWAATQLFRDGQRMRLLAGACFALLLVYSAYGLIYRLIDVPEYVRYWQDNRDKELAQRGWQADSFEAQQFEKKLTSGEMVGFDSSPNTFAAVLVMLGIVTVGAAVQRWRDRDEIGWLIALLLPLIPAVWVLSFTNSKAADVSPLLAAALMLIIGSFGRRLLPFYKLIWLVLAALMVFAALAVALVGNARGGLFVASLTFRWHYWLGATRIFRLHPLLGVGWANFGAHYLAVRLPLAAEEVKDPHNLVVKAAVELGVVGGCLMIGWLGRLGWEMLSPAHKPDGALPLSPRRTLWLLLAIGFLVTVASVLATVDLSGGNAWYALLLVLKRLLYLGLILLGLAVATMRSSSVPRLDERPARWIGISISVAVVIFLIHNLIDFSIFEPGPMILFATLAGAAVSRRDPITFQASSAVARLNLAGCILLWLAAAGGVVAPIALAESRAADGDDQIRGGNVRSGADALSEAFNGLWISNADYAYRAAYACQRIGAPAREVRSLLALTIAADPLDVQLYRNRAAYESSQPDADARRIIADFETALKLDPNEVSLHVEFAQTLNQLGQHQRGVEELKTALAYNDQLNPDEPKRLSARRSAEVHALIEKPGP